MSTVGAAERISVQRQLVDLEASFRETARQRVVARKHGDLIGVLACDDAIDDAFRQRAALLLRLGRAEGQCPSEPR